MEDASFSWGGKEAMLSDLNIRVEKGELVAVVGSVGSGRNVTIILRCHTLICISAGKSSLLSAFLGEMDRISGRVNTVGRIAYVRMCKLFLNERIHKKCCNRYLSKHGSKTVRSKRIFCLVNNWTKSDIKKS